MRAYEIRAVGDSADVVVVASVESAVAALAEYRAAFGNYRRVWVSDENGDDVTFAELSGRASAESAQST